MSRTTVALFMMSGHGHFSRLYALIRALSDVGADACVFTEARFAGEVRAAGGRFFDLYACGRSVDALDSSTPRPIRNVTFAAVHGAEIAAEVASVRPAVVVADSHAVIGLVVAKVLGIPYVSVRPGHDLLPQAFLEQVAHDPRLSFDERSSIAVETLRERFGILDASPFSYCTAVSPLLNICCEPEVFVSEETRRALEPVVFFGSLRPLHELRSPEGPARHDGARHVYASFGTVVWAYWAEAALAALEQIAAVVAGRTGMTATISLGDTDPGAAAVERLSRPGVTVERFVDQWTVLGRTDVFFTHHGLNSTHEAIYNRVPMISFPFSGDQPSLAEKAQRFGLAVPLGRGLDPPPGTSQIEDALDAVEGSRADMLEALDRARAWELETMENRPEVARRIVALA